MTDDLTRDGKLKLRPGEQVPNRNYKRHTSYEYLKTGHVSASFSQHPTLNFLRRVNVQKAVNELRNLGLFPFKTLPSSMPDGISVDNFAQVKLIFHCYYCYFEGVTIMYETHVLKIVYTRFQYYIHTYSKITFTRYQSFLFYQVWRALPTTHARYLCISSTVQVH